MNTTEIYLAVWMIYFMVFCVLFARKNVKQDRTIRDLRNQLIKKENELIDKVYVFCPCCGRRMDLEEK